MCNFFCGWFMVLVMTVDTFDPFGPEGDDVTLGAGGDVLGGPHKSADDILGGPNVSRDDDVLGGPSGSRLEELGGPSGSGRDDILGGPSDILLGIEGDTKLTPEAIFVEEYVRSGNAFLACNKAGLSDPRYPMEVIARRTLERAEIKAAIGVAQELKRRGQLAGMVPGLYSREMLLEELQRTHEQALGDRQYGSAIGAVKVQAQILGYLEQTVNVMHSVSPREMSLEDLRRLVSERAPVIDGEFREVGNG